MNKSIERYKLEMSLALIDRIVELISANEYRNHLYGHLISIQVELQRQLSHY